MILLNKQALTLDGSAGDEEPLVNAAIDRSWGKVLASRDSSDLVLVGTLGGTLGGLDVGKVDVTSGTLASDELLPGVGALVDDVLGVLLVLTLAREGELVLGLAVGDLVDTEPLVGGTHETGQVALNVLNVVELGGQSVVDVDDNDLPVGLLLVDQGHDTKNLDLLDLTRVANKLTDLANVERVVVTLGLGLRVNGVGVLPGLWKIDG